MFSDIGFFELMVIGVIALLVLGPERLPGAARSAGETLGKFRRMLESTKAEFKQELNKYPGTEDLKKLKSDLHQAKSSFDKSVREHTQALKTVGDNIHEDIHKDLKQFAEPKPVEAEETKPTKPVVTHKSQPHKNTLKEVSPLQP